MDSDIGAKPFQTPVILVSDVSKSLAGLFRDFVEGITFKEMKFQGLPLLWRKLPPESVQ